MKFPCARCGKIADKPAGHINRSHRIGAPLYCGRGCAGIARRRDRRNKAQKIEDKRLYDIEYRKRNRAALKAKHQAYHMRTYDPDKARVQRKKRMPEHVEYCRRPEYRRWKREYDRQYRAKEYGAFADAYQLTIDLNREIKSRSTNYEISQQNETFGKAQNGSAKATSRNAVTVIRPLTASSLKDILWETLTDLKHENILPNRADAIAAQSREILRTIKTQIQISGQSKRPLPQEIVEFSERR